MTVSEIKRKVEQLDIYDVVKHYVKLKKHGTNYTGLCPFHDERSPSFKVNPAKNIFKCFGCGIGGDAIEFVMKQESLTFVDAMVKITEIVGMEVSIDISDKFGNDKYKPEALRNLKTISKEVVSKTLNHYQYNNFYKFIEKLAGTDKANEIVTRFYIGTNKQGGTIYWQVDQFLRPRTANVIYYKPDGHRDKNKPTGTPYDAINRKPLFTIADGYGPCFFGEHQLIGAAKQHLVALVESEKTAVICSMYLPVLQGRPVIYLASCGMQKITDEKMWVLRGLDILLIPDFSYTSRATWGSLLMCKKVIDGALKPAPDGELQPDFVSVAAKLQKLNCNVFFFDPCPNINDGTDIADLLTENGLVELLIEIPDFTELELYNTSKAF